MGIYSTDMKYILVLLAIILGSIGIDLIRVYAKYQVTKNLIRESRSFSFRPENPAEKILVAGDSTAVGTGVSDPIQSIAGRFHHDFPNAEIVNVAHNGFTVREIIDEVTSTQGPFDLVVLQAGANDIIFFASLDKATKDMKTLLEEAKKRSSHVVLLTSGNIGIAPIFWPPLSWVYSWRTMKLHQAFRTVAKAEGIPFVELYKLRADDPFAKDENKYYAADGTHLTGDGYAYWYLQIRNVLGDRVSSFR